jgi:hypothetical protein
MKVALCISGLSRTYKESFDSLHKYIIEKLNPDIFISTWHDSNNNAFNELYKPLSFESEIYNEDTFNKFVNFMWYVYRFGFFPKNLLPMYYKIFKANLLKINHENFIKKQYDLVIRARSDLLYCNDIPTIEIKECLDNKNLIFCRKDTEHDSGYSDIDWCWDQFAFGSSYAMNVYSDTINNIDSCLYTILEKYRKKTLKHHLPLANEFMFRENLYNNGIQIKHSNIKYQFIRQ